MVTGVKKVPFIDRIKQHKISIKVSLSVLQALEGAKKKHVKSTSLSDWKRKFRLFFSLSLSVCDQHLIHSRHCRLKTAYNGNKIYSPGGFFCVFIGLWVFRPVVWVKYVDKLKIVILYAIQFFFFYKKRKTSLSNGDKSGHMINIYWITHCREYIYFCLYRLEMRLVLRIHELND